MWVEVESGEICNLLADLSLGGSCRPVGPQFPGEEQEAPDLFLWAGVYHAEHLVRRRVAVNVMLRMKKAVLGLP